MLKKHNKLIMLLVLVTFMFTMVGSAGAATYSDVTGTSSESAAIYRLSGLGVLDGYPDGTFGPEKTITRAEFAKIACVTAGLKSVASGMGGTASPFSDVATDHWANGWINVAAAQGFVKGDPAGTFRPEDQITQAEAITVLLRLLGYNDNLPGEWPSDYIAKAANLGVLDDITFVANQAATRGVVAVLASATLDENVVEYVASDNLFNEASKTYDKGDGKGKIAQSYTLLYDKFKESAKFKNVLAIQFRYDSEGDTYLEYFQYNDDQDAVIDPATGKVGTGANTGAILANVIEKKLAKNCVFSGGGSILTVIENFVEFDVNDDGDISSIVVKDYASVGPELNAVTILDEVKVESSKAKAGGKTYSFLPRAEVVMESIFPTEFTAAGTGFADGTFNDSDAYRLILNKNGKIAGLCSYTIPTPGIVDKVVGDRIYYMDNATPLSVPGAFSSNSTCSVWAGFSNQGNFTDEDIYVQRDGKPAKLADIQPLDTVSVLQGYRGTDYYIIATSLKIPGKLQSAEYDGTNVKKVKVMDLKWAVPYTNFNFLAGAAKSYTARYSV
ncbi:MAG: S-layer homology domain-containing protein, partial [Syntrophomonadaceae bacterium]|nr:S-layer homology domain-containing protein [Syntrophomonadaceae bacterium]